MTLPRLVLTCLGAGAFTTMARAQAGLEYAARSAGSALSNGRIETHLGVCPIDSSVVPCLHQYYPTAFYVAIIGICLALGFLLYPKSRT